MKISGFTSFSQVNNNNNRTNNSGKYPNLAPLKQDTVSFSSFDYEEGKLITEFQKNFTNGIEKATAENIFRAVGIKCEKDPEDGKLIISNYKSVFPLYTDKGKRFDISFFKLGIDENKLFKDVKEIKEDADFRNSKLTDFGNLKSISGDAYFGDSQVVNLGNLESIGGYADFRDSQVTDLGSLQSIGDSVVFSKSQLTSLGNLKYIGGDAYFDDSQVADLGNLEYIGRNTYVDYTQSELMTKLEERNFNVDYAD